MIFFTFFGWGVSANACGYNDENEFQQESFLPSGWRNVVPAGLMVFLTPEFGNSTRSLYIPDLATTSSMELDSDGN